MRNTKTLLPILSAVTLLSFLPESNAASPTQEISPSAAVKKATPDSVTPDTATLNKTTTDKESTGSAISDSAKSAIDPGIQELMKKGFVIFIPKGTRVSVIFDTNLSSDKNRPGEEFSVSTAQDILLEKAVLLPKGTIIKGTVLDGQSLIPPSAKLVALQLRFDSLNSPAYGKINTAGGKLLVKGDAIPFVRGGKKLVWQSLFVTTPYRPLPPPDCNAFKTDKGKKIEIAAGDKFDFEFSSDVRVSPP
ncbi:MAG: hypothetical protein JST89_17500 [Cyanobacteria bacterium SZAS-4]|nr:hypothetical protein [Cyanobacteria bacterium SZAS-4]